MLSITAIFDSVGSMLSRLQSLILNWCRTNVKRYCAIAPQTEFIIKTAAILSTSLRLSSLSAADASVRKNAFIKLMRAAHLLECGNQQFKTVTGIVECAEREVGKLRLYVSSLPLPEQVSVRFGGDFRFLFRRAYLSRAVGGLFYLAVKIIRLVP